MGLVAGVSVLGCVCVTTQKPASQPPHTNRGSKIMSASSEMSPLVTTTAVLAASSSPLNSSSESGPSMPFSAMKSTVAGQCFGRWRLAKTVNLSGAREATFASAGRSGGRVDA